MSYCVRCSVDWRGLCAIKWSVWKYFGNLRSEALWRELSSRKKRSFQGRRWENFYWFFLLAILMNENFRRWRHELAVAMIASGNATNTLWNREDSLLCDRKSGLWLRPQNKNSSRVRGRKERALAPQPFARLDFLARLRRKGKTRRIM